MKTASFALTFAIAALLAAPAIAAPTATLDSVQVRPSAEQIAQRTFERNSGIATLTAVQVRPSAEQLAQRDAELSSRIATLASVQVRPSAEQIAQRATEQATSPRVVTLTAVQVRPSADTQSVFAIGSVVSGALDSAMLQLQPSLQNLGQDLTTSLAR
ncbi:hypothetical protein HEP73_00270 [Xanthomonas sp. GW]|uniref:hypothetical protein n=1 Tax=unclassified Xanthomonas TaxID=2643310 RepID=UPI00163B1F08|nr:MULTISPECIES: hypothetical protein [unclassified Xanthomonas]QNH10860.1 hypothetical protein HEP75_00269 [Xanthomonas sp. SI]QNH15145.1 hypothetical protein HEP74_00263 [Xanthomonas sp. SS]QNH19380.1 hypothetical protein HEP73_00270 [Xanthomonas sp. GW]